MSDYVLDASAIMALLNQETGGDRVLEILSRSVMSAVNLSEVVAKLAERGIPPLTIQRMVDAARISIVPFDETQARQAGLLRTATKPYGISLADSACIALAIGLDLPVVTSDRKWQKLPVPLQIVQIR